MQRGLKDVWDENSDGIVYALGVIAAVLGFIVLLFLFGFVGGFVFALMVLIVYLIGRTLLLLKTAICVMIAKMLAVPLKKMCGLVLADETTGKVFAIVNETGFIELIFAVFVVMLIVYEVLRGLVWLISSFKPVRSSTKNYFPRADALEEAEEVD